MNFNKSVLKLLCLSKQAMSGFWYLILKCYSDKKIKKNEIYIIMGLRNNKKTVKRFWIILANYKLLYLFYLCFFYHKKAFTKQLYISAHSLFWEIKNLLIQLLLLYLQHFFCVHIKYYTPIEFFFVKTIYNILGATIFFHTLSLILYVIIKKHYLEQDPDLTVLYSQN